MRRVLKRMQIKEYLPVNSDTKGSLLPEMVAGKPEENTQPPPKRSRPELREQHKAQMKLKDELEHEISSIEERRN